MAQYTISVFKSWGARDSAIRWVNSYEIDSPEVSAASAAMVQVAAAIANAERQIHLSDVQFLSARISTWTPDSTPYNPASFTTVTLQGTGARGYAGAGTPLDMNVALMVHFTPQTGRAGKRFYRGVLLEGDVESTGNLRWKLSPGSVFVSNGSDWQAFLTALAPYYGVGTSPQRIVLIGRSQTSPRGVLPKTYGPFHTREVSAILPGGVVFNRADRRYFDRGA